MRNFNLAKFLEYVGNLGVALIAAAIIGLFFQQEGLLIGFAVALAGATLIVLGSMEV